jgi:hypothetical protein
LNSLVRGGKEERVKGEELVNFVKTKKRQRRDKDKTKERLVARRCTLTAHTGTRVKV